MTFMATAWFLCIDKVSSLSVEKGEKYHVLKTNKKQFKNVYINIMVFFFHLSSFKMYFSLNPEIF